MKKKYPITGPRLRKRYRVLELRLHSGRGRERRFLGSGDVFWWTRQGQEPHNSQRRDGGSQRRSDPEEQPAAEGQGREGGHRQLGHAAEGSQGQGKVPTLFIRQYSKSLIL